MNRLAHHLLHLALLAGLLTGLACSGASEADSAADAAAASAPATAPPPKPPPPPQRPKPVLPEPVVVLEDASDSQAPSLVEAARRERERQKDAKPSQVVITDENLAEHATGQVTVAVRPEPSEKEGEDDAAPDPEAMDLGRDEVYWRDGVRDRRLRLRRAVDEVLALEEQVAGLRLRFYAEDDPYVRDSRIKPAWDRSLERLRQARQDVASDRRDLDEFLETGHRAGALPGWLREAAELEPTADEIREAVPEEERDIHRHRPKDPDAVDPNPNREDGKP